MVLDKTQAVYQHEMQLFQHDVAQNQQNKNDLAGFHSFLQLFFKNIYFMMLFKRVIELSLLHWFD